MKLRTAPELAVAVMMLACQPKAPSAGAAQPGQSASDPVGSQPAADAGRVASPTESGPPPDLLTFAGGAIPLRVEGSGARFGATLEEAVEAIDGSTTPYAMVRRAPKDVVTEIVIELPAPTTFSYLAVPHVHEVPSKLTTFTRVVEVHGSATGPDEGYTRLASATLTTHATDDEITPLTLHARVPVRWVKLQLSGGIAIEGDASNLEFSEIIGHGSQESVPQLEGFSGVWRTRGASFDLAQDGPVVTGCYDDVGELEGTVTGNILRARGTAKSTGVRSHFVLTLNATGDLRGLRSTNGAPFRVIESAIAPAGTEPACPRLPPPKLGCGSVLHGIGFQFDSAEIRPESAPILERLFDGLRDGKQTILVEGHTSDEGKDAYNRDLSKRRAQAVVDDLVERGIARERVRAVGRGPDAPIADNGDEAGRSMNRRVEIVCE